MSIDKEQRSLTAKVERVIYPTRENDDGKMSFRIIKTDKGSCKGNIGWRPTMYERITFTASNPRDGWHVGKFGPEFCFTYAQNDIPIDEKAMLTYACELTRGMGETRCDAIWEAKGKDWRKVTADDVKISENILREFRRTINSLEMQDTKAKAIAYLLSLNCTMHMAEVAWEMYGAQTISKVQSNCYVLAELPHYSFAQVDQTVSHKFGIGRDDPRRIEACINYYMSKLGEESSLVSWSELYNSVSKAIDATPESITFQVKVMFSDGRLHAFPQQRALASDLLYRAEHDIAEYILGIV